MSNVIYTNKTAAIAVGLRWSVFDVPKSKTKAELRTLGKAATATRYAIDIEDSQKYLGLYTPGSNVIGPQIKRIPKIYSLALIFLDAILSSSNIDRAMINAVLVISPPDDHQNELRALIVIDSGKIIYDGLESRGRATEIVNDYRIRSEFFQIFSDKEDFEGCTLVDWAALAEHAKKSTSTQSIPRDPIIYLASFALFAIVAGQGAYYQFVTIPEQKAEEARRKAAQDRTPLYVKALQESMKQAGWSIPSMIEHINKLHTETYYYKGWALKNLECGVNTCEETWNRYGGILTDLLAMREGGTYIAEKSMGDKSATIKMPVSGISATLTTEMILSSGLDVHKVIKPVLNKLENAGASSQWGETSTWPTMQMTGVRPDVIVKRTRLEIYSKYPLATETLSELPPNFVPESFSVGMEQDMSITIKGFLYEK